MAPSIPFATVEDVEKRIGYTLDEAESERLELFLEDFSLVILHAFEVSQTKSIEDVSEDMLKMVTARRAADWQLSADLLPGQTSFSETVGDRAISGTVSAGASKSGQLQLTSEERSLLGLKGSSIYSFNMSSEEPRGWYYR